MTDERVSRRGVYYDLTISPYEFNTPYGDIFKFPSQKKLDIYARDVEKELERFEKLLARHGLGELIPSEIKDLIRKRIYQSFYSFIVG